jgi:hypothetical protein
MNTNSTLTHVRSVPFPIEGTCPPLAASLFSKSVFLNLVLGLFFLIGCTNTAFASHFRYGNISWRKTAPLTVEFKVSYSERRSFGASANVGDIVNVVTFYYGDGGSESPNFTVTAQNNAEDWIFGEAIFSHTYASSATYTAGINDCCRISTLAISGGDGYILSTDIDLTSENRSPISSFTPIVCVAAEVATNSFSVGAFDPDGDPLTFSLNATTSGLSSYPLGLTIDNSTGLVTFNTVGIAGITEYAAQVLISDGHTSIPVDFIIRVVASTSAAPVFDYMVTPANGSTITASVGVPVAINLKAIDPNAEDMVSLSLVGQPAGSTFSTALPALGNPSMTTLNWTPTVADIGQTFVINAVASSGACESAITNFRITVGGSCAPPTLSLSANSPACPSGSGSINLAVVGGSGTQNFVWAKDGDASFSASTQNLSGLTPGTYKVTLTDACGMAMAEGSVGSAPSQILCPLPISIECKQLDAEGKALPRTTGELQIFRFCFTPDTTYYKDEIFDVNCGVIQPNNYTINPYELQDVQRVIVRIFTSKQAVFSYSCAQLIYIRQSKIEDVYFPSDRTLTCANLRTEPTDTTINNSTVAGTGVPSATCNLGQRAANEFQMTYTDDRTTTATGFTIQRTWTATRCVGTISNKSRTVVQNITVITCTTPSVAGGISRENGTAVPSTTLIYNGATGRTDSTTGTTYKFSNLSRNTNLRIKPTRPNTDWTNGVTMLDVSLLSRHLLDINPLSSPYNLISADVNRDGALDAVDMLMLQRLILHITPELTDNNSWRFILKNYNFPNPSNPFNADFPEILTISNLTNTLSNADFVAIKVGDLNQSAGSVTIRGGAKPFNLTTEDLVLEQGKTYTIPIQMTPSVSALQFTLKVDKNNAKIESISTGELPNFTENNTGLFQKEGIVTAAWYKKNDQSMSATDKVTMMNITLKATKTMRLSDILSVNSLYTEGVAYDAKEESMPVQLVFGTQKADNEKAVLLANRPNPFSNETTLSFTLPEAGFATLTVCDLLGKVVMAREQLFAKGLNEVIFSAQNTPSVTNSIFVVRLKTQGGFAEQKIILNR